jgi:anti-sigma B factor antagonist
MHIEERQVGAVIILDAVGRMTFSDGEQLFKEKIYGLVYRGQTNVVVNLGGITYLDSAGLGAIVASYTTISRVGGRLVLLNLTKGIHDLLSITRLLSVFDSYASEVHALRGFAMMEHVDPTASNLR